MGMADAQMVDELHNRLLEPWLRLFPSPATMAPSMLPLDGSSSVEGGEVYPQVQVTLAACCTGALSTMPEGDRISLVHNAETFLSQLPPTSLHGSDAIRRQPLLMDVEAFVAQCALERNAMPAAIVVVLPDNPRVDLVKMRDDSTVAAWASQFTVSRATTSDASAGGPVVRLHVRGLPRIADVHLQALPYDITSLWAHGDNDADAMHALSSCETQGRCVLFVAAEFLIASCYYEAWCDPLDYRIALDVPCALTSVAEPHWQTLRKLRPRCLPDLPQSLAVLKELSGLGSVGQFKDYVLGPGQKRVRCTDPQQTLAVHHQIQQLVCVLTHAGPSAQCNSLPTAPLPSDPETTADTESESIRTVDAVGTGTARSPDNDASTDCRTMDNDTSQLCAPIQLSELLAVNSSHHDTSRLSFWGSLKLPSLVCEAVEQFFSDCLPIDGTALTTAERQLMQAVALHAPLLNSCERRRPNSDPSATRSTQELIWMSIGTVVGLSPGDAANQFASLVLRAAPPHDSNPREEPRAEQGPEAVHCRSNAQTCNDAPQLIAQEGVAIVNPTQNVMRFRCTLTAIDGAFQRHLESLDELLLTLGECMLPSITAAPLSA